MGAASNAGQNLRKNAQNFNFGQLIADSARDAFNGALMAVSPAAHAAATAIPEFIQGVATPPRAVQRPQLAVAAPKAAAPVNPMAARALRLRDTLASPEVPIAQDQGPVPQTPFEQMVQQYAQANGGISMHELSDLSDVAYKTGLGRMTKRTPTAKDVAGLELKSMADEMYTAKMAQAQAAKGRNPAEAARLQGEAVKERMEALKAIMGANPVDLQTAAAMNAPDDEGY